MSKMSFLKHFFVTKKASWKELYSGRLLSVAFVVILLGKHNITPILHWRLLSLAFVVILLSSCVHIQRPEFTWPVEPPHNLSRRFSIYHEGIDFPKGTGHPVFSVAKGTVIYAGSQFSGYGKVIIVEHEHQWASLYAHLSQIHVKTGEQVKKKQKIGAVGSTGRSSSPHLHFELIYKKQPRNPVPFLPR